jgi:hypothetical protein
MADMQKRLFVLKFCIKNIKFLRYYTESHEGNSRGYAESTPARCYTENIKFSNNPDKKNTFLCHALKPEPKTEPEPEPETSPM